MQTPIIIGVIIAVMALVTFSGWFYELASGMGEFVLDDQFFNYRIGAATLFSIIFMVGVFWVISLVNECPKEKKEGIFAGLNCDSYLKMKATADEVFKPKDKAVNETLD